MFDTVKFLKTCYFEVAGTPIPWSAPDIGNATSKLGKRFRFAKKNPALIQWQSEVHDAARKAYGPYEPSAGPIFLNMQFVFQHDLPELHDELVVPVMKWNEEQARFQKVGQRLPDRTNLVKGVEDALQDVLFVNDTQVRFGSDSCVWGMESGCRILVGFIDPHRPRIGSL